MRLPLPHSRLAVALAAVLALALVALGVWRGLPGFDLLGRAFGAVQWEWVGVAAAINLFSVAVRALAWKVVLDQALPPPHVRRRTAFAAFCIGLLANVALPGRVGEVARVAVLSRRLRRRRGTWATIAGTVFAHRLLEVVVALALVLYVLYAARIPRWAVPVLAIVTGIGLGLLLAGLVVARRHGPVEELGPIRRLVTMARQGLAVLHRPAAAVGAVLLHAVAWGAQLVAVWAVFNAFRIEAPLAAAALVLLLVNLALIFPLWPGNVGLVQAAVALPLLSYGVSYPHGLAFGVGLQAIEASVGVGLGLLFLAREGYTFALLKRMQVREAELADDSRIERVA